MVWRSIASSDACMDEQYEQWREKRHEKSQEVERGRVRLAYLK